MSSAYINTHFIPFPNDQMQSEIINIQIEQQVCLNTALAETKTDINQSVYRLFTHTHEVTEE